MGTGKVNVYIRLHGDIDDGLSPNTIRVHHGNESVDTTSPIFDHDDYESLRDSTASQTAFDAAASGIGGTFATWYAARTSDQKAAMRATFARL